MSLSLCPTAGPARPYRFPASEQTVLANGVHLFVATLRRVPVVSIMAMTDAGATREAVSEAGLASLTNAALAEGTTTRDANALADAFDASGGSLETDTGWLRIECNSTVMSHFVRPVVSLLGEVLQTPAFPEAAVARLREERLAELLQQLAEPRGLADERFARAVYRRDSRYAYPDAGSDATVRLLKNEDVRRFHARYYSPEVTTLIVAGDVTMDDVLGAASEAFGGWSGASSPREPVSAAPARLERALHFVAKPDAAQSEVRLGHTTVGRTHPDFYALSVMNAILGGLFNSRINLNLREKHGYTYGAFTAFDWRREASTFEVSSAVRSDATTAAIVEALGEIDRMREEHVSESELSLARDYLTGVFPIRFETTAAVTEAIAARECYALEADYYDTYRQRIAAITTDDVLRVAQEHLDPHRMQVVAVGDPATTLATLEKQGFGSVVLSKADAETRSGEAC